jgi:hypothetical protein
MEWIGARRATDEERALTGQRERRTERGHGAGKRNVNGRICLTKVDQPHGANPRLRRRKHWQEEQMRICEHKEIGSVLGTDVKHATAEEAFVLVAAQRVSR